MPLSNKEEVKKKIITKTIIIINGRRMTKMMKEKEASLTKRKKSVVDLDPVHNPGGLRRIILWTRFLIKLNNSNELNKKFKEIFLFFPSIKN